jgi:hypothetical protein
MLSASSIAVLADAVLCCFCRICFSAFWARTWVMKSGMPPDKACSVAAEADAVPKNGL